MNESAAPTPVMGAVGFSWVDVTTQAEHVVNLLRTHGDTALNIVSGILKLIKAVTMRDMATIFLQLNQTRVDVEALIAAVKEEFGLN